MDIRAQVASVFHLDKCIGCHTCSIACKNIWTDREGTEYMWWNNVETKPGTGYPTLWEDQRKYRGGFIVEPASAKAGGGKLRLKLHSRLGGLTNIFFNPYLPTVDDYYEPWTYQYDELFNAPEGDDQPTARAISMITGRPMDLKAGPNWDDDLGGSDVYAANDPNKEGIGAAERGLLDEIERVALFYIPRICNHCLNAGCVGACPSGAIYKRGEDGIVLISQDKCRGWRMCVSGCPYKKSYYNWRTGKSEKCIYCYPRLESGQATACFHACVGRIRYLGLLLYDADQIECAASVPDADLVEAQRAIIQDPFDPKVIDAARASGVSEVLIAEAQKSPIYKFFKLWKLALPLHPEFRTLPMLFYVPPLLPVIATVKDGRYDVAGIGETRLAPLLTALEQSRLPLGYMSSLFSAGNDEVTAAVYRKLIATRIVMRRLRVGDISAAEAEKALEIGETTTEEVEAIFNLTARPTFDERFVVPPMARELAVEATTEPGLFRRRIGFGDRRPPSRRW